MGEDKWLSVLVLFNSGTICYRIEEFEQIAIVQQYTI
jgi:hypothetical protein